METKQIYGKMIAILNEVGAITKSQENREQKYTFRGIDDVYNALHPIFKKHGVFVTSEIVSEKREVRPTKSGGNMTFSILQVKFTYFAEDGSSVTSIMAGEAQDTGDKASNKAMSAAQKYSLIQMFLIPTSEGSPDSDKGKSDGEVTEMLEEILKFTDKDMLIAWANSQEELHGNEVFTKAVKAHIKKLSK